MNSKLVELYLADHKQDYDDGDFSFVQDQNGLRIERWNFALRRPSPNDLKQYNENAYEALKTSRQRRFAAKHLAAIKEMDALPQNGKNGQQCIFNDALYVFINGWKNFGGGM